MEKAEVQVPMLFVQEEVFDSMTSDIREKNNAMISVKTNSAALTRLKTEYTEKIPLLSENKDKYTVEEIIEYIGSKPTNRRQSGTAVGLRSGSPVKLQILFTCTAKSLENAAFSRLFAIRLALALPCSGRIRYAY